jgi:prophage DNA circulation protein
MWMPEVKEITTALQQAGSALGKAQTAASQMQDGIRRVQTQVGSRGYRAMAANVGQLQSPVKQIHDMLSGVATTLRELGSAVQSAATADGSPAAVIASLTPVAKRLREASSSATAIQPQVTNLKTSIAGALKGGNPGPLTAMANQVGTEVGHVASRFSAAAESADKLIADARQLGNFPMGAAAE